MIEFVESCVQTAAGGANQAAKRHRHRPRARHLLHLLADKKQILVTTHRYPDPDALASVLAMRILLVTKLKEASVTVATLGSIGGINTTFAQLSDVECIKKFEEIDPASFDAIILLDTQPRFTNSPLPEGIMPTVLVDHHRSLGRRPKCGLTDIRADVGATSSIIFSYFMELDIPISRELGAMLLYAIESDLAGAAGTPGELDNIALSSLTLLADSRLLYRLRYANMSQSYYIAYATGLNNAVCYDKAIVSYLEKIDTPEKPAVIADFLLRYDQSLWALVLGISPEKNLVLSLRTSSPRLSAADIMRRLMRNIGNGGGHRTKAGGSVALERGDDDEIHRLREKIKRRFLRILGIKNARPQKLVPKG
ncbi:MAG: DHH family phosphoesterase [Phycisphaerales bacterium]|nr:DHH family phosphoesterase [Phycisphaerales bacterium]